MPHHCIGHADHGQAGENPTLVTGGIVHEFLSLSHDCEAIYPTARPKECFLFIIIT